ncbi:hypothetical protein PW52_13410 [Tamlana sedimentorum]|uniref:Uncharacterized protein n=1 Tax=Neotamlana sedimentorum TaxID=1435349 RepID=A0A0D7W8X7_9FLAO|nr:S41 family peptidase [Tamlana sedimentorum]KJD34242.1 hypothetical protein PW52_13410 [Tamlana sedimentorum]
MNTIQKVIINFLMIITVSVINVVFAQSSREINWTEDLEIYKSLLEEKHINLYHSISKEAFYNQWKNLNNNIKALNDFEIIVELMRLTRQIGDGHTAVSLQNVSTNRFPFEIKYIDKQWRVVNVSKAHKNLLKLSLISIENTPIEEVTTKVSKVTQFVENEYSQVIRTESYLNLGELLHALKITKKPKEAVFTFLDANNQQIKITLKASNQPASNKISEFVNLFIGVPEITKPNNAMFPYLWYAPIKHTKAIYINFKSYPTFEDMQVFGETLVNTISENKFQQVIIDMRDNGGGDLYVGAVLAYALNLADTINWKNGVYVLTSNKTFSAATSNAALYKQLLNAKIVGEATGSNPNGYQDMDSFVLPNSKLTITYSKRLFRLSHKPNCALQPDLIISQKWDDFLQGTDTVLKELIEKIKK